MPSDVGCRFAGASCAGLDYPLTGPILPDVGVVALVPEEWNLVLQPRHQVLFRLARYFHIAWVDPPRLTGGGGNVRTVAVWCQQWSRTRRRLRNP
jgi:hypothetical protein